MHITISKISFLKGSFVTSALTRLGDLEMLKHFCRVIFNIEIDESTPVKSHPLFTSVFENRPDPTASSITFFDLMFPDNSLTIACCTKSICKPLLSWNLD